jgi:hypothetical protein
VSQLIPHEVALKLKGNEEINKQGKEEQCRILIEENFIGYLIDFWRFNCYCVHSTIPSRFSITIVSYL